MEVVLGKLKLSNSAIADAILSCDIKTLPVAFLESLIKVCPTESEISDVANYEGD